MIEPFASMGISICLRENQLSTAGHYYLTTDLPTRTVHLETWSNLKRSIYLFPNRTNYVGDLHLTIDAFTTRGSVYTFGTGLHATIRNTAGGVCSQRGANQRQDGTHVNKSFGNNTGRRQENWRQLWQARSWIVPRETSNSSKRWRHLDPHRTTIGASW